MMRYHVTHTTRYIYQTPVSHCLNEVRLTPRSLPGQYIEEAALRVDPQPTFTRNRKDYFGNDVISFEVFDRHDRLETIGESVVEVQPQPIDSQPTISWEETRDRIATDSDAASIGATEFIYNSPYVPALAQLAEYAGKSFTPQRPVVEAVLDLTHRIHSDFKYLPKSTSIDVPLADVVKHRRGVCQDFAHVMIGVLRSMRLAARYVSGYVRPGPKVQGAQASHAWVGVFVPESGWINFDPTNDLIVSDTHVTLAWGRDYGDVTPVKGFTLGGGRQTVQVEVYVKPL
jgi:transglutaminase-like putative cysteine protease